VVNFEERRVLKNKGEKFVSHDYSSSQAFEMPKELADRVVKGEGIESPNRKIFAQKYSNSQEDYNSLDSRM
jgi:hypothetical protein